MVTFKRYDGIKNEKLEYFGGSLKNSTFRGGGDSRKTNIKGGGLPKKGAWTVSQSNGGLVRKRGQLSLFKSQFDLAKQDLLTRIYFKVWFFTG